MINGKRVLGVLLMTAVWLGAGQPPTVNEFLVMQGEILGQGSGAGSPAKLEAIRRIRELGTVSSLAAGLLFERANAQYEVDPRVREAAALALPSACDVRNRMSALRLVRIAHAAQEPDPGVRIAALKSLALFECAEAAACIYDAAKEGMDPDPRVRVAARILLEKGIAGSLY